MGIVKFVPKQHRVFVVTGTRQGPYQSVSMPCRFYLWWFTWPREESGIFTYICVFRWFTFTELLEVHTDGPTVMVGINNVRLHLGYKILCQSWYPYPFCCSWKGTLIFFGCLYFFAFSILLVHSAEGKRWYFVKYSSYTLCKRGPIFPVLFFIFESIKGFTERWVCWCQSKLSNSIWTIQRIQSDLK